MLKVVKKGDDFVDLTYSGDMPLPKNTVVLKLSGKLSDKPTRTTIQIGPDRHIDDETGKYINHACDPTCRIVGDEVVSIKEINNGDSITFDYNESEDIVAFPFRCNCGHKMITGRLVKD